jgi:hypothetical protein
MLPGRQGPGRPGPLPGSSLGWLVSARDPGPGRPGVPGGGPRPGRSHRPGRQGGRLTAQKRHNLQGRTWSGSRPRRRVGCWSGWCGGHRRRCGRCWGGRGGGAAIKPGPAAATGAAASSAWPSWPPRPSPEPSSPPAASSAHTLGQVPSACQRCSRPWQVCQGPNRPGTSRHGRPVCSFHRMPPRTWRWSRHGLPRRLSAGSNHCTRLKAASVSSNIALLLGSWTIQERDAIGQHRHQQQSAAAVLMWSGLSTDRFAW